MPPPTRLSFLATSRRSPTPTTPSVFRAAEKAMQEAFGASVDYIGIGATEPIAVYYQQILKPKAVIFNAYNSPRDNYHGDDESFSIDKGFIPGIKANLLFYQKLREVRP